MMESFTAATDLHGDRQDKSATRAFLKFVADFKPKKKFFLGDIFDFRAIRTGADEEERRASMKLDFHRGMDFLDEYQPDVITLGNHDQRLWDIVEKDGLKRSGPLVDYAGELIERFQKLTAKIEVLPYNKRTGVYSYKGLKLTHGFVSGKTAARTMAAVYGNVLFGHGHSIDEASEPGDEPKVARMIGCLCLLDQDYNRAQMSTLRQQHGWAYGAFHEQNVFDVFQARVNANRVTYAENLKTVKV